MIEVDDILKEIAFALLKEKPKEVEKQIATFRGEKKGFCPTCKIRVINANMRDETYCENCGQHLAWEE